MMAVRVRRAITVRGSRNTGTPLLTASTPVMAVQPLANACMSSQTPAAACRAGACAGGGRTAAGCPPASSVFTTPAPMVSASVATNR
jgi:hypothetical protein